eukprot:2764931-Rhodomonas_salina.1
MAVAVIAVILVQRRGRDVLTVAATPAVIVLVAVERGGRAAMSGVVIAGVVIGVVVVVVVVAVAVAVVHRGWRDVQERGSGVPLALIKAALLKREQSNVLSVVLAGVVAERRGRVMLMVLIVEALIVEVLIVEVLIVEVLIVE